MGEWPARNRRNYRNIRTETGEILMTDNKKNCLREMKDHQVKTDRNLLETNIQEEHLTDTEKVPKVNSAMTNLVMTRDEISEMPTLEVILPMNRIEEITKNFPTDLLHIISNLQSSTESHTKLKTAPGHLEDAAVKIVR